MYELLNTLSESRLVPSVKALRVYRADQLSDLAVLYVCAIYILYNTKSSNHWASEYARRTIGTKFNRWSTTGTDLHAILYGLTEDDVELKNQEDSDDFKRHLPDGDNVLIRWLRDIASNHLQHSAHRALFTKLDYNFKIANSSIKAIRRLVMDWEDLDQHEKKLAMTRLLQMLRSKAARGELVSKLERVAREDDLEIEDACNKETGEGCHAVGRGYGDHGDTPKRGGFLAGLAGFAAGMATSKALHRESATAGSTGAASVATVVGGLGAGFDPNGDKGIYEKQPKEKKPVVLKR